MKLSFHTVEMYKRKKTPDSCETNFRFSGRSLQAMCTEKMYEPVLVFNTGMVLASYGLQYNFQWQI